jgi:hypothetical protein
MPLFQLRDIVFTTEEIGSSPGGLRAGTAVWIVSVVASKDNARYLVRCDGNIYWVDEHALTDKAPPRKGKGT